MIWERRKILVQQNPFFYDLNDLIYGNTAFQQLMTLDQYFLCTQVLHCTSQPNFTHLTLLATRPFPVYVQAEDSGTGTERGKSLDGSVTGTGGGAWIESLC